MSDHAFGVGLGVPDIETLHAQSGVRRELRRPSGQLLVDADASPYDISVGLLALWLFGDAITKDEPWVLKENTSPGKLLQVVAIQSQHSKLTGSMQ